VTFKIMAAIHWEALRLWLKGARIVARPTEGQFGGQTAGTREQKIWTQSHITLMELRDV
jgi:DUF1365 family protein